MITLVASDLSTSKWAFDVSESVVSAVVGGLAVAIVGKRLGFSVFAGISWISLVLVPCALISGVGTAILAVLALEDRDPLELVIVLLAVTATIIATGVVVSVRRAERAERIARERHRPISQTGRAYRFSPLVPPPP